MLELIWHIAEVVDIDEQNAPIDQFDSNTETNKPRLGRVQLKFIPGHSEMDVTDPKQKEALPWARPFMHSFPGSFNPPAVGSKVWAVVIDEYYKNIFYLNNLVFNVDVPLDTLLKTDFQNFPSEEKKLNIQFPQFRFFKLPNGSVFFFDTVTKELGIWYAAGVFVMFANDGSIVVRTTGQVDVKAAQDIKITTEGNMPLQANGTYLGQLIIDLVGVVEKTIDGANYISPVGPCTSPLMALKPTLTGISTDAEKFKG